jgi:4-hydroxy-tetrahydrodipicolinate reductase
LADTVLGVVGATGRLGSAVLAECARLGVEVGVTATRAGWDGAAPASVLVDASAPEALEDTIGYCERTGAALIYCVSTLPGHARDRLVALSARTPVVRADNLSIGHWLQMALVRAVAELSRALPRRPRMSVRERHPATKRDRPSASARALAATWACAAPPELRGATTVFRGGPPVSDHVVTFDVPGMALSIGHSVTDLTAAASALLGIADHVRALPPGWYPVTDVYSRLYGDARCHDDR